MVPEDYVTVENSVTLGASLGNTSPSPALSLSLSQAATGSGGSEPL